MKTLFIPKKKMVAAAMRLLAIVAILSGAVFCCGTVSAETV